jgi:hypothetical protein
MMATTKTTLESLVSNHKTKDAILLLKDLIDGLQEHQNPLIALSSRYSSTDDEKKKEVSDQQTLKTEFNRIDYAFLNILSEVRDEIQSKMNFYKPIPREKGDEGVVREFLTTTLVKKYKNIQYFTHGNSFIYFQAQEKSSDLNVMVMVLKTGEIKSIMDSRYLQKIAQLKHRNLIQLLDVNFQTYPYYIITEHVTGIDLKTLMKNIGALPLHSAKKLLLIIGDVINTLKIKKFPFTGIRPSRVLIDQELQPEISPFDILAVDSNKRLLKSFIEDSYYFSNETLFETPFSKKCAHSCDSNCLLNSEKIKHSSNLKKCPLEKEKRCEYAKLTSADATDRASQFCLAALGYEMITGTKLFDGQNLSDILMMRHRFFTDAKFRESKLNHPFLPKGMSLVFKRMLQEDPQKRYDDIPTALKLIAKVSDKLEKEDAIAFKSYLRCLNNTDDFLDLFYENLFSHPEMVALKPKDEETEKKRELQQKFYIDINMVFGLQNFGTFVEKLTTIEQGEVNPLSEYTIYLDTFINTIAEFDPRWDNVKDVEKAWNTVRNKVLDQLKVSLPEPETPSNFIPDNIANTSNIVKPAKKEDEETDSEDEYTEGGTQEDTSFDNDVKA